MSYSIKFIDGGVHISNVSYFDPSLVFDCGQCFRFSEADDGRVTGIAGGNKLIFTPTADGYDITGIDSGKLEWLISYLSLDDDYEAMREDILRSMHEFGISTSVMENAMEVGKGIRILNQDPWETLCSFIISQNNNIPRIKKIVEALSVSYGEKKFTSNGDIFYDFPTPDVLASAGVEKIFELKTGFRAKYIHDAAKKISEKTLRLDEVSTLEYQKAAELLMTVSGVGPKVAACALLFGFKRLDGFPVDVWVKKIMAKYYPSAPSYEIFGKYAGLAQQYLFYYERYLGGEG